jgi:hypothetical protein
MLSRGFNGVMPRLGGTPASPAEWVAVSGMLLPVVTVAVVALVMT